MLIWNPILQVHGVFPLKNQSKYKVTDLFLLMGIFRRMVILLVQSIVLLLHGLFSGLGLDKAHVEARRMFD